LLFNHGRSGPVAIHGDFGEVQLKTRNSLITLALTAGALLASAGPAAASTRTEDKAASTSASEVTRTEYLGLAYPEVLSIDVHNDVPGREWQPGDPVREIPRQHWADPAVLAAQQRMPASPPQADPLAELQARFGAPQRGSSFTTPLQNFEGAPGTTLPPDPTGDIGTTQFVQAVNASGGSRVRVYNKETGALEANFILATTLTGTTPCNQGLGDPIVVFDAIAQRWLITEFSPSAGRALCVYVSANADAANTASGNWYRYTFVMPAFPDYPKYGVWNDGYYVGANENGTSGQRPLYVMERAQMLQGLPARFVRVTVPNVSGFGFQLTTPAHFVGSLPPPAGAPGIFMRHRDDEAHNAGSNDPTRDFLELWQLSMNWAPATPVGTLSPVHQVPIAEFSSRLNGLTAFQAFPQPNGQRLDPLREPVMNVLMYRNFGTHESLVGNLVTNTQVDPAIRGAVRWFELRRSSGTGVSGWQLHNEGTYAPTDADGPIHRWMAGIGIDSAGNLAMGYSVVRQSPALFAGLRYVGRLASDPPGVMTTGESLIVNGERSQTNERWGDYAQMGVDPVDGCTFWFTGEYMGPAGTSNNTRIASFRHSACGEPAFTLSASPNQAAVCAAQPPVSMPPVNITVGSVSGFTDPVALALNPPPPTGISGSFGAATVTPPGATTLALTLASGVAAGPNTVTVEGSSGALVRTTDIVLNVATALPAQATLVSPANNATNVILQPTLSWSASSQAASYVVEVATDSGFTNIVFTGNVNSGTNVVVGSSLASNTLHYWRVRPSNICGAGQNSAVFSFRTQPAPGDCSGGAVAQTVFSENFSTGAGGFTTGGTGAQTWALSTVRPSPLSGGNAFLATDIATISDQQLTSPAIVLPTGQQPLTLKYQNFRAIEENGATGCYDGGVLEISVDGGAFTQITGAALLNDPYRGPIAGNYQNPLAGLSAWCDANPGRPYADTLVDLSPYAGSSVRLRWRLGTDSSVGREGWYVDDVRVQSCLAGDFIDPAITLSVTPTQALRGQSVSFTAPASNQGTIAASNVVVDVVLPTSMSLNSVNGTGWNCSIVSPQTASCTRPSLANGTTAPVTFTATVGAAAPLGAASASVAISSDGPDAVPSNNSANATVNVVASELFSNGFETP
jgi:uncharacterized repeat protein (TIGR01451 family)